MQVVYQIRRRIRNHPIGDVSRAAGWHAIRFATNDQAAADFEALLG